jgi:hypothetical protein
MKLVPRLGAAVAACVLLAGCGDDSAAEPGTEPTSSGSPSSADSSPGASESASEPSVAPATGRLVRLPAASVRAPEGWTLTRLEVVQGWEARDPEAFGSVFLYQPRAPVTTLDGLIEGALNDYQGKPKVSFDAELGGEPAFRAVGKDAIGHLVTYGAVRGDTGMELAFGIDEYVPAKERKRIEESVVASFEWR